ncbi:transglutaminase-like domain-containing protein [Diaphorobacter aerolatus]|uniref:Transglutaminase domain-containing protein n=1 Tax=Diaphorobacter aerolatus TaxID=1288495 RepID=A0A7H0GGG1_9BURK|nr:transglutaminase-like domain-containing protein [Diaphorobacter aerolatus]QNP47377.1 transglutaminase domain-containing protein [Diaphorobacter aerolatus]
MQRRHFLSLSTLAATAGGFQNVFAAPDALAGWRQYEVVTKVNVAEQTALSRLWIPVPLATLDNYQRTLDVNFNAPGAESARMLTLPGSDVRMVAVKFADAGAPQSVEIVSRVATRDRAVDLGSSGHGGSTSATSLRPYLQATSLAPLDGIVKETADRIQAEAGHPKDTVAKARAIYEWIVENAKRNPATAGCGTGDVSYTLTSGNLSGKCADLNGLFTALARATRIPARDVYGVRVEDSSRGFKSLGKSGDISKAQHCRAEFYADGHGWIPVDPADVAKVMLEEQPGGLPKDAPKVRAARAMLFGAWEGNWMAYNTGADVRLPGSNRTEGFFMYPQGETANGRLDSLDPAHFAYTITSRKLA